MTSDVITDWDRDSSLDKAAYAWSLLGDAMGNDLASAENSTGLDMRRRLAMGNISRAWQVLHGAMTGSAQEIADLTKSFIDLLSSSFTARFNQTGIYRDYGPAPDNKPTDAAMIAAVTAAIKQYATGYASANLGPTQAEDDSSPSANSQALVLQLDHLAGFDDSDPVSNGAKDDDPLRSVAGLGILMQQALPGGASPSFDNKWHALNLGGLTALDPASSDYAAVPGAGLSVTPVRVPYRDGAKQAIVTYDNTPLATRSLLSQFADLKNVGEATPTTTDTSPVPAFRFEAITDTANNPWARLPALKYGQVYNILPFAIGNSGALPKELAGTHPAQLRTDNNLTNLPAQVITDCQRTVAYRRRVGIGPPRLSSGVVFNQQTAQARNQARPRLS